MIRAIVNIYGKVNAFLCCGDCRLQVSTKNECIEQEENVHHFYGGLKYMIAAGWGLVKNEFTGYEACYMCPKCFEKYKVENFVNLKERGRLHES